MYAVFTMVLLQTTKLQVGHLIVYDNNHQIQRIIPATSGMAGYQCPKCQWIRGRGPMPERNYEIDVKGAYGVPTKGIQGWAYPLSPDPILGPNGKMRSQIMMHRDVGFNGSAGCLVLQLEPKAYREFNTWFRNATKDQKTIPLRVRYKTIYDVPLAPPKIFIAEAKK